VKPVFFAQQLNGIGYPRCVVPAKAIDAECWDFDEWCKGKITPQEVWEPFAGRTAVFQLVANWARLHAMRDYRQICDAPVVMEVDDDYLNWDPGYIRGIVTQEQLDHEGFLTNGWVKEDVAEYGHPFISSPEIHRRAAAEADAVIVSTPHLAEIYQQINQRVYVCRNLVDPEEWPERDENDDVFRVVFSASPNPQDLAMVRYAMEWAAKQEGVEAWVVGVNPRFRGVKWKAWTHSLDEYRRTMAQLRPDVWLRPIETRRFAKSKSDLKVLECAMVGALPIVTNFEPYALWRGSDVLFAVTEKDWQQQVRWSIRNRDEVKERAASVRETVLRDRGPEAAREDWGKALRGASIRIAV
jgi:hypothetical protein